MSASRSSELHKLRAVAKDLFQLLSHYFSCEAAPRCLNFAEICMLLGIQQNVTKPKYPTFPPLLYVNQKVDLCTLFCNWELLASVHYFFIHPLLDSRSSTDSTILCH